MFLHHTVEWSYQAHRNTTLPPKGPSGLVGPWQLSEGLVFEGTFARIFEEILEGILW